MNRPHTTPIATGGPVRALEPPLAIAERRVRGASIEGDGELLDTGRPDKEDLSASVLAQAARTVRQGGADTIDSADLLVGAMTVSGGAFDQLLRPRGRSSSADRTLAFRAAATDGP